MQMNLFEPEIVKAVPSGSAVNQLLKWIGNKQRFAPGIISRFPARFGTYLEPFLGSGAVLGTLSPSRALGSDVFTPLIGIWQTLKSDPELLARWYEDRWVAMEEGDKVVAYELTKASYNASPNPADLLFLSRSCYGGVVRFRKVDGYMSTPCGIHRPISPSSFARRVLDWHERVAGTDFMAMDYKNAMEVARPGDLIYCDPPYSHSQAILYGAQSFSFEELLASIERCKSRGVFVALSIDGTKKSGDVTCDLPIPIGLFEQEILIDCGRSMLRRFQMEGRSLEEERVADRLLLTYR